ncbi:hypothetical protein PFISCL1PPCAC_20314, partial [Pristionchus fissidentatus]
QILCVLLIVSTIFIVFLCTTTKDSKQNQSENNTIHNSKSVVSAARVDDKITLGKLRQHDEECDLSRSMVKEKGKNVEEDVPSLSLSFTPTMEDKKEKK